MTKKEIIDLILEMLGVKRPLKVNEIIVNKAKEFAIPEGLLRAIVKTESSGDPFAIRYEPHYRWLYRAEEFANKFYVSVPTEEKAQKTSWGLMQVMGAVAREKGFRGRFLSELCDPEVGLEYGCKHLKGFYNRYGNWKDAIASYNAGSPRKKDDGTYVNQYYVDKVMERWEDFKTLKKGENK